MDFDELFFTGADNEINGMTDDNANRNYYDEGEAHKVVEKFMADNEAFKKLSADKKAEADTEDKSELTVDELDTLVDECRAIAKQKLGQVSNYDISAGQGCVVFELSATKLYFINAMEYGYIPDTVEFKAMKGQDVFNYIYNLRIKNVDGFLRIFKHK